MSASGASGERALATLALRALARPGAHGTRGMEGWTGVQGIAEQSREVVACDLGDGLWGWVIVHDAVAGRASGGLRILPDVTRAEVETLARAMAFKYAFHDLPMGGAKAGLTLPFGLPPRERAQQLARFGEAIAPLLRSRRYSPYTDMNCTLNDVRDLLCAAGLDGAARRRRAGSALHTAHGVLASIDAVRRHGGGTLAGCRVAIEGYGAVGRSLAALLAARGARVVAVSTRCGAVAAPQGLDVEKVGELAEACGDAWVDRARGLGERIDREALFALDADVLVPGARPGAIRAETVSTLGARAVVPIANAPCEPAAERALADAGVVSVPDFVSNGGGVLGPRLERGGFDGEALQRFFERDFRAMVTGLLDEAERSGRTPGDLARERAGAQRAAQQRAAARARRPGRRLRALLRGRRARPAPPPIPVGEIIAAMRTRFASPQPPEGGA